MKPTAANFFRLTLSLLAICLAGCGKNDAPAAGGGGGTTGAATLTLSTSSLAFSATIGATAAAQTVTATNTGTAALTFSSIAITGTNATQFADTSACTGSLAVNATCTVSVTFSPTVVGTASASLVFSTNASNSPQSVSLTGTASGIPALTLSATSASFSEVVKLLSGVPQIVKLTNSGTGTLTFSSIAITGTNTTSYSQTNTCAATLAPAAFCNVTITFTPQALSNLTANLVVLDNTSTGTHTVPLTGIGVKAHLKGLVTMNNSKTIGGFPDDTMEELNAHPNIYVGAVIKVNWSQLEPTQGVFVDTAIETAMSTIDAYNAKYPTGPKVFAKLRINVATAVPAWLLTDAGSVVTTNGTIAAFWSPEYTKQWRLLIAHLASVYNLDERLQEIASSSCASNTDEPFVLLHGTTDTPALIAAGYTDVAYHNCLNGAADDYAPFTVTPVDFTFNGEGSLQASNVYVSDQNAANVIMNDFRTRYPVRSVVANHGLQETVVSSQATIYGNFTTLYNASQANTPHTNHGLEFQTLNQQVNWDQSVATAMMFYPSEIEIWDTTAAGGLAAISTTQLQTYAAQLAALPYY